MVYDMEFIARRINLMKNDRIYGKLSQTRKFLYIVVMAIAACRPSQQDTPSAKHVQHILELRDTADRYLNAGDSNNSLHYYKKALHISQKKSLTVHQAHALIGISKSLPQDDSTGIAHLYSALGIADSIGHFQLKADIYLAISETHRQQDNYKEALHALEEHHKLIEGLLVENKNHELSQLKASEQRKLWQLTGAVVVTSLLIIIFLLVFYSRKLKSLNGQLSQSLAFRDKLFSIIGHDLREPASALSQALSLFGTGALGEREEQEMLVHLKRSSESLRETLDNLLQWANAQFNEVNTDPHKFDPYPYIEKSKNLLLGQSLKKKIGIHIQTAGDVQIYADENQFDFIIRNLLANAIKFSPLESTVNISIEGVGEHAVFSIADTGIGLSAEQQQRFLSGTGTMKVNYGTAGEKGVGLGLALTKLFVTANNGKIWFESEENRGTTVHVSLPLATAPETEH